jgi:secreted trypsin-like serine protease
MRALETEKGYLRKAYLFSALAAVGIGCAKTPVPIALPSRSCVPNPFKSSAPAEASKTLGIVNGMLAGNSDLLEKSTVGIIMQYDKSDGTKAGGLCTGVIAGKDVVITAAHCFRKPEGTVKEQFYVTFKLEAKNLSLTDVIVAEKVITHPNYSVSNDDIAVMKLVKPVPAEQMVASFVADTMTLLPNLPVTAIGYGVTGTNNRDSGIKRRTDSFVMNIINATNYATSSLRNQIRIVDPSGNGRGGCYGDSGGPGFIKDAPRVFGVVQGVHPSIQGGSPSCERADYNYTLIAPFIPWLEQQIGYKLNVSGKALSIADAPSWGMPSIEPGVKVTQNSTADALERKVSAQGVAYKYCQ